MEQSIPAPSAPLFYYESLPLLVHRTGDVWSNLPGFDLFDTPTIAGIVITPACDLAHDKSSTISYIPVIDVTTYITQHQHYALVRPKIIEALEAAGEREASDLVPKASCPAEVELEAIRLTLTGSSQTGKREAGIAGVCALQDRAGADRLLYIKKCLGKDWQPILKRIICNSYSEDLYFLPPAPALGDELVLRNPSVAVFRYPLTIPRLQLDQLMRDTPQRGLPLKCCTLRQPFLSNLLNRFARLYMRIGSPDFSIDALQQFANTVDKDIRR